MATRPDTIPEVVKKRLNLRNLLQGIDLTKTFPETPGPASAYQRVVDINPDCPPWPVFRGYYTFSFANAIIGHRLPTILGKAIEDDGIVDLLAYVKQLEGNGRLRPIIDDGEADIALWNKEIAKCFIGKDFMNATWLFAETYKYRRLRECFAVSKKRANVDVFFRPCDTFSGSRSLDAIFDLSTRFAKPYQHAVEIAGEQGPAEAIRFMFFELSQVCLWGNSTDLSLPINMTEKQIKSLQSTMNILGNHMNRLWEIIRDMKGKGPNGQGGRTDFVLDNVGFELYCDCVYADFPIQAVLVSEVRFHGKRYPWFVSDVTKKDWEWLLNIIVYGYLFPQASGVERESLSKLGQRWKQHPFWCTGFTFWDFRTEAPDLFLHLSESDLVVFKGDFNNRKVTYERLCAAPASTPFEEAIEPIASAAGAPRVCSMRTIKSNLVVGLGENGNEISAISDKEEDGLKISGKYAMVLVSEGRPGEPISFA
ncbi:hypothetical protein BDY19DRAFT_981936 [Irpex rosettiformis]|uniref:Uncharacterized protein n=1 Tax=Irpex rosettiformis TaxID=378272 RepID=A0ACB8UJA2_9APHY|nr:hypothetical protein BDY19DRAFT_981936 [Irpex rosettiformis]